MIPETSYAKNGEVHLAYQVWGEGDLDIVLVPGFLSHVEMVWELPAARRFYERLGSFARVIAFDRRGTGLSDPFTVDRARAVLPAVHVPTLVLHRRGDRLVNVRSSRYLAEHIEGARLVEVPGLTTRRGSSIPSCSSTRSRSSSPAHGPRPRRSGVLRPCSSATSSGRPSAPRTLGTRSGETSSIVTTARFVTSSSVSEAPR